MQPVSQLPPVLGTVVSRRVSDGADIPVIPDCCNVGITARILVALNVAALLLAALTGDSPADMLTRAAVLCGVLEPVAIASLVALCGVRRVVSGRSIRVQWVVGLAVPTVLVMVAGLIASPYFVPELRGVGLLGWLVLRGLGAVAVSALAFEYFRLRSLSFAPSLADARLQALQARIRPHFLYNSINAVLSLIRAEPRRAEAALEDLASLFRVLMADNRELTPLAHELELARQYLDLEQLRLGDRLRVEWHVDKMPRDALVPPLVLQPLLENAVYHGIEPRAEPGTIAVDIYARRDTLHLRLRNPYEAAGRHHGGNKMALANIRERLALHFDAEATLDTRVGDGSYEVRIALPYVRERGR